MRIIRTVQVEAMDRSMDVTLATLRKVVNRAVREAAAVAPLGTTPSEAIKGWKVRAVDVGDPAREATVQLMSGSAPRRRDEIVVRLEQTEEVR